MALQQDVATAIQTSVNQEVLSSTRQKVLETWRQPAEADEEGAVRLFVQDLNSSAAASNLQAFFMRGWCLSASNCIVQPNLEGRGGRATISISKPQRRLEQLLQAHPDSGFRISAPPDIAQGRTLFIKVEDPDKARYHEQDVELLTGGVEFGDVIPSDSGPPAFMTLWAFKDKLRLKLVPHYRELQMFFQAVPVGGAGELLAYKMVLKVSDVEGGISFSHHRDARQVRLTISFRCPPNIFVKRPRETDSVLAKGRLPTRQFQKPGNDYKRGVDQLTPDQAIGRSRAMQFAFLVSLDAFKRSGVPSTLLALHLLDQRCTQGEPLLMTFVTPAQWEGWAPTREALEAALSPEALYMVECLVSRGLVSRYIITEQFVEELRKTPVAVAVEAMTLVITKGSGLFTMRPSVLLQTFVKTRDLLVRLGYAMVDSSGSYDNGNYIPVPRIQVTPTRVVCWPPEMEMSNRVLRRHAEYRGNFLRASFADEDGRKLRDQDLSSDVSARIRLILDQLRVAGRDYEFLAYGSSQLKEHGCWFFSPILMGSRRIIDAHKLREHMGDFTSVQSIAKRASRIGQSLSSTVHACRITNMECTYIEDIEVRKGRNSKEVYCFSDGVGQISQKVANEIFSTLSHEGLFGLCPESREPSAYQFRYGGCKGMVTVHPYPHLKGRVLALRKSQIKFESQDEGFGVVGVARWMPCFLNRQIIAIMSTRLVEDGYFLHIQDKMMKDLRRIHTDRGSALKMLSLLGEPADPGMATALKSMIGSDFSMDEPWLRACLTAIHEHQLMLLRTKSRVLVQEGCVLYGVMDEFDVLEYGEVFIQMSDGRNPMANEETFRIIGDVVVTRNPALHPGDLLTLQAVVKVELMHLVDVIVFPQHGPRPHPNEMSGGDLDGDMYWITWDPFITQPLLRAPRDPMDFSVPATLRPLVRVPQGGGTVEHLKDFFVEYLKHENVGLIADSHKVWADQKPGETHRNPLGVDCDECIQLAQLHSLAVDFAKSGVPAVVPQELSKIKKKPDWMEKDSARTYISDQIIGHMFRAVKAESQTVQACHSRLPPPKITFDPLLEMPGCQEHLEEARRVRSEYECELLRLMDMYKVFNEAELLTGCIRQFHMAVARGQKEFEVRKRVGGAVANLQAKYRAMFEGMYSSTQERLLHASAWYVATYKDRDPSADGESFQQLWSFPWIVYDHLAAVKLMRTLERQRAANRGRSAR